MGRHAQGKSARKSKSREGCERIRLIAVDLQLLTVIQYSTARIQRAQRPGTPAFKQQAHTDALLLQEGGLDTPMQQMLAASIHRLNR